MSDITAIGVSTPASPIEQTQRKIVLLGPSSLFHDALRCLIENRLGATVTHFGDERQLIGSQADLILFDVDLEKATNARLDQIAGLLEQLGRRPVLLITTGVPADVLQRLLRDGVAGIVPTNASCDTLLEAIDAVSNGKVWLNRDLLTESFGETSHTSRRVCSQAGKIAQLTQREREIVKVACSGLTNRQVAERLRISEATVRHHLSSIFSKLGTANRGELIVFGFRHGLCGDSGPEHVC